MWNEFPSDRLRWWYNFRLNINKLPLDEAIEKTNHLWAYCPYQKYYLLIDQIDNWPTPWELIYDNIYCDLAKCLGIVYTLYLTSHQPHLEIRQYNDKEANILYNLVWVDKGKYVLNLEHDTVVNKKHIQSSFKLEKKITITDLKLEQIQ
jgi:hypothetical protein